LIPSAKGFGYNGRGGRSFLPWPFVFLPDFFWWANYLQFFTENRVHFMTFRHPVILVLCLVLAGIPESVFAIDLLTEKDFRALRFEHKKMNSRLDQVINEKLRALQSSQESLLRQIEEIKNTLPEIQGSVEVNKSETVKSIGEVSQKLADIKTWLNDTLLNDVLMREIRRQEEAGEKLRVSLTAQFGELKGKLAEDIEALSQNNERYLLDFSRDNNDRLKALRAEIRALRAEMHGSLASFKDFFRDELIPFFEKQYEADRKALREEVAQAKTEPEGQSDVNRETSSGNLGTDVQNETNSEFMERMLK
jgi:peptidoglycan hydrolase CwlO-like protein